MQEQQSNSEPRWVWECYACEDYTASHTDEKVLGKHVELHVRSRRHIQAAKKRTIREAKGAE